VGTGLRPVQAERSSADASSRKQYRIRYKIQEWSQKTRKTIRGRRAKKKLPLAAIEAATTAYYDSLSDAEVEEDRRWGEFAETHLALKNGERAPRP
jgi:hypothetical protein